MLNDKNIDITFFENLKKLGFQRDDDVLFLVNKENNNPNIKFHLDFAREQNATAVYFRKQLNGSYNPQVYLYDFTDRNFSQQEENDLANIQKAIWSSGEVPLICIVYKTEIKIINGTTPLNKNYKPDILETLKITSKAHKLYNEEFAIQIKSGVFWDKLENKNKFSFANNSAYNKLIGNIRYITNQLKQAYKNYKDIDDYFINKIIVQAILIKYLEERIDSNGKKLLSDKYFKRFAEAKTFNDVLRKGYFVELLEALNNPNTGFNGNIFEWTDKDKDILRKIDLSLLADLLEAKRMSLESKQLELFDWRYFEFKYIPVELISRLYEEFLGTNKKEKGLYYTPAHLVRLLVDESLPLSKYKEIDVLNYRVLDPACGSGIFLVSVFKRLVQIWRLQNNMKHPEINTLKQILSNLYGVDKEKQAIELASFSLSLALTNELNPIEIIEKLKFDDLKEKNLITSDFFEINNKLNKKFDLVIGNPPFKKGAIKNYNSEWKFNSQKIKIPQGQIALKFLAESTNYLKEKGLLCLIIKSSSLLYNTTSFDFKKLLFSNFNVIQILDFTALARNKVLWENGADVAAASIFLKNEKPNIEKNILHLTFRRTKATKEKIIFEIDDYDLHFIDRQTAINNPYIWKNNLLGGGRIRHIIDKVLKHKTLIDYLNKNNAIIEEGYEIGKNGKLAPDFMYNWKTLPTKAINENIINYDALTNIDKSTKFKKIPPKISFEAPNIIIWENIGEKRFPIFINNKTFTFKRRLVSIKSINNDIGILKSIHNSFSSYFYFYKFFFLTTSSETLINRNNTFLLRDLKNVPFVVDDIFSNFDKTIISDVNEYLKDFFISGERSKAVKPIPPGRYKQVLTKYGEEFSKVLNLIYEEKNKKFRLSDVVKLKNSLIATIFKYDSSNRVPVFHTNIQNIDLKELSDYEISKHLTVNRIIKLYPDRDTIVFIKPNQYRYWLSLIAYRDADKCFADFSKMGY